MKPLLYKEFKLCLHPICYIFLIAFPFMVLIPNYPLAIGFIYVLASYPILFLGANKGQQSNDLLFSTLMPVRKKDIVLARIITLTVMQFFFMALTCALLPLSDLIRNNINQQLIEAGSPVQEIPGLSSKGFLSILGFVLICYGISDLIFLSIYYKNGKSIVKSTLLSILAFTALLISLTVIIPSIPLFKAYKTFLCDSGIGWQFLVFGISLAFYFLLRFATYKVSSKRFEKVDF